MAGETEPTAIVGALNTALTATLGVLTVTSTISQELAGALGLALAGWVGVGAILVRSRVTPNSRVLSRLTPDGTVEPGEGIGV